MQKPIKNKSVAKVKTWFTDGTTQTDVFPENEQLRKKLRKAKK